MICKVLHIIVFFEKWTVVMIHRWLMTRNHCKLLDPKKHDSNSAKAFIFMAITNESAELSPSALPVNVVDPSWSLTEVLHFFKHQAAVVSKYLNFKLFRISQTATHIFLGAPSIIYAIWRRNSFNQPYVLRVFPCHYFIPADPLLLTATFWVQSPQRKSSSPFGKGLTVYRVYEGGMSYFHVLIHANVWCAVLLKMMFNLEEVPIKLVQIFRMGSTKLYDVSNSEGWVALSSTFFSSLMNICRLLQTECMQVELSTF
jgi:hypothetical protein